MMNVAGIPGIAANLLLIFVTIQNKLIKIENIFNHKKLIIKQIERFS